MLIRLDAETTLVVALGYTDPSIGAFRRRALIDDGRATRTQQHGQEASYQGSGIEHSGPPVKNHSQSMTNGPRNVSTAAALSDRLRFDA
jgi:hypothetical protein